MYQHGGDIYTNQNMLDFSANINFRGMPVPVREAARAAVDDAIHYPDVRCRALKRAIAEMDGVPETSIFCGNGAADVIGSLVRAVKPKRALLPVPSFYEYRRALEGVGCEVTACVMRGEDGFRLRADILEQITGETDLIFLCNPNNPTGLLTGRDLMKRILQRCETTGTLLVADECFMDLTEEPERFSLLSEVGKSDRLFILKAFTKTFAMPGLRLGYGICRNGALLQAMEEASQPWRVSVPAQAAGVAAAAEPTYLRESRRMIGENRRALIAGLRDLGCNVWDSAANFVFFSGEEGLAERLLRQGILIRDCANFEGLGPGYYRAAVRSGRDVERLLDTLRKIQTDSSIL
ncbi:MAG: aminotransferase class I/II-fold pyridoxal phosphate-dependent enzyme [Clostridiales bacterium]|nr:aminotransferase class I/II-fold pyridoxal phosphate-dependent enzyme [Clostridiales bacterium]